LFKPRKSSLAIDLSTAAIREVTDALVILSMSVIAHAAIADWGGMEFLHRMLGWEAQAPSILYFLGVALVVFSMRRISDQRTERARRVAAEQRAHEVSICDPLTGLPNRGQFETEVADALKSSQTRGTILLLGLDQFKKLNNLYGHLGCDAALAQVARRLRDGVPASELLARTGDDEFAVFVPHADADAIGQLALDLVKSVKEPVQIGLEHQSIAASVGIAQSGRGPITVGELLRCAHVALSRARATSVEFCFFDPKMDAHVRERSILEKDLRAALGGDEIRPWYQPIVDLKTNRIVSFESLARWNHPVRGFISPEIFVPMADELGLTDQLSGQLFGDACRDAATWPDDISLSFNFSPAQLADKNLAEAILMVLRETGLPPRRLEVEITESALVADLGTTRHVLQTLRNAGARIVIDDFGTGYSSFYHLYELRFDKLKIDKRFVQELGESDESEVFIRAIIGLSRGLDLRVTAEGVETQEQAEAVYRLGAHQGQGYLYGKAAAADHIMRMVSAQAARAAA
jgi:diguanylate cyclase (GGDEF)-like protein